MFDLLERTLKGYSKRLEGMAMRERLFVLFVSPKYIRDASDAGVAVRTLFSGARQKGVSCRYATPRNRSDESRRFRHLSLEMARWERRKRGGKHRRVCVLA